MPVHWRMGLMWPLALRRLSRAALGADLRAGIAADIAEGQSLLSRSGRDGGRILVEQAAEEAAAGTPPTGYSDAESLAEAVQGEGAEAALARRLLRAAYRVDAVDARAVPGPWVLVDGEGTVFDGRTGLLRRSQPAMPMSSACWPSATAARSCWLEPRGHSGRACRSCGAHGARGGRCRGTARARWRRRPHPRS